MSCQTCHKLAIKTARGRGDLGDLKAKVIRAQSRDDTEAIADYIERVHEVKDRIAYDAAELEEHQAECKSAQRPALSDLFNDYAMPAADLPPAVDLVAMLEDGWTREGIAEKFGCSASTVGARITRSGLLDKKPEPKAEPVDVFIGLPDTEWEADALCSQTDPEMFFPEKGGSTKEAKATCGRCTVAAECLDAAIARNERFGIWGGLSERERRKIALQTGARVACPTCGLTFSDDSNLSRHRLNTHDRPAEIFSCSICDYTSSAKQGVTLHVKRSHPDTAQGIAS